MNAVEIASARISAIAHATEDTGKVVDAMFLICPDEEFHPRVERQVVKGHFGNVITRIDFVLRRRSANSFFESLWSRLSDPDRSTLLEQLANRLDDDGKLHMRIDKQELFRGNLLMRDSDPIRVQVVLRGPFATTKEIRQHLESLKSGAKS